MTKQIEPVNTVGQTCECNGEPHAPGCPLHAAEPPAASADAMICGNCAAWLPAGNRHGYGLCCHERSHKDETDAADGCEWWEAI